jgi:hypothetical protein
MAKVSGHSLCLQFSIYVFIHYSLVDLANVFYTAWDPSLANHLLGINPDEANGKRRRKKIISKLIGISIVPLNGRMVHSRHIQRPVGGRPIVLTFQNMEKQGQGQIDRPM